MTKNDSSGLQSSNSLSGFYCKDFCSAFEVGVFFFSTSKHKNLFTVSLKRIITFSDHDPGRLSLVNDLDLGQMTMSFVTSMTTPYKLMEVYLL